MKRMLFASHHCYLDQSNGASITTRQILLELSARGWEVDAFCGAGFDYESGSAVDAAPWIHAILRLWDDSDFYKVMRAKCDKEAHRWRYSPIADQYENAFSALLDKDDA